MSTAVVMRSEKYRLGCRRELLTNHDERRDSRSTPVTIAAGREISSKLWQTKAVNSRAVQLSNSMQMK